MAEQTELELWPRKHDLPPLWDGMPVEWGEWSDTARVMMCPPPRQAERCSHCQSTRAPMMNIGRIWTDPKTAPPTIGHARMNRGSHFVAIVAAFRCLDCQSDSVLDSQGGEWILDATDYTDKGSWELAPSTPAPDSSAER